MNIKHLTKRQLEYLEETLDSLYMCPLRPSSPSEYDALEITLAEIRKAKDTKRRNYLAKFERKAYKQRTCFRLCDLDTDCLFVIDSCFPGHIFRLTGQQYRDGASGIMVCIQSHLGLNKAFPETSIATVVHQSESMPVEWLDHKDAKCCYQGKIIPNKNCAS